MPGKATTWTAAGYGLSIDTLQNYAPRMERRLVRHCMNCNRTIHFQMLLILVVVACLQSPTYQVSPGVLHRLEDKRSPHYELQPQSLIPGVPYLSGPVASAVTHRPVIPGPFPPYLTLRLHPPSFQSRISFISEHEQNADDETDR